MGSHSALGSSREREHRGAARMSTLVYPPIAGDKLKREAESTAAAELSWLLNALQEALTSLKSGLEECADLLAPREPGSTLVLSSLRSENLKGFVTRVGTRIVKADIHLRLPSLPPPRGQNSYRVTLSTQPTASEVVLTQLLSVKTNINAALDIVDATRWTGDHNNADFISGQLQLLHESVQEAKAALKGINEDQVPWHEDPISPLSFIPPLPPNLSLHFSIAEAAVVLNVRTLEAAYPNTGTNTPLSFTGGGPISRAPSPHPTSLTGFSLRERLATALGGQRPVLHDEVHEVFMYKSQEVRVRDKVRVESQDPSLIAALAKLGAVERSVNIWRRSLAVVMGKERDEEA